LSKCSAKTKQITYNYIKNTTGWIIEEKKLNISFPLYIQETYSTHNSDIVKKYSQSTINSVLSTLKQILRSAEINNYLMKVPRIKIINKGRVVKDEIFTIRQVIRILKEVRKRSEDNFLIGALAATTGGSTAIKLSFLTVV